MYYVLAWPVKLGEVISSYTIASLFGIKAICGRLMENENLLEHDEITYMICAPSEK